MHCSFFACTGEWRRSHEGGVPSEALFTPWPTPTLPPLPRQGSLQTGDRSYSCLSVEQDENEAHAQELQLNKVNNGGHYVFFFPQRFDTVITVITPAAAHALISIHLWCSLCSRSYFVIICCHLCLRCSHSSLLLLFKLLICR